MAVTKLAIYNEACLLLGQRILATVTDDTPVRYDLDALYAANTGLDYCIEIVKPKFALKVDQITGSAASTETEYTYEIAIPSDYLDMEGLYYDGKLTQPVKKYYTEDGLILTDVQSPYLRYARDFATVGLTNMPTSFSRVVGCYFARELAIKYDPDLFEALNEELNARIEIQIGIEANKDSDERPLDPIVLDGDWLSIYNDVMNLYGLDLISSVNDDSMRKSRLDQARNAELVEACMEDIGWHFANETAQLTYEASIEPEWGYTFAFIKPADVHRLDGLFVDEHMRVPLKHYQEEYDSVEDTTYYFCSYQTIYLKYVSSDYVSDTTLWPSYFKRYVAAQLAMDCHSGVKKYHPDIADINTIDAHLTRRRKEAKSTDAMISPPRVIAQGSWSRARYTPGAGSRGRP